MPAPTPNIKGLTTISWGSDNAMNLPAGAIIESLRITPKNGGPIAEIEDNNGATVSIVDLNDGFDAEASLVYDTNKAWPGEETNVVLNLPKTGGNGGSLAYPCHVTSCAPSRNRKKEAMIDYKIIYRPGVHGAAT